MPNNKHHFLFLMVFILLASGCAATKDVTVKGYIQDKKRVDQEVGGVLGNWKNAPQLVDVNRKDTRKIVVVEVTKDDTAQAQQQIDSLVESTLSSTRRNRSSATNSSLLAEPPPRKSSSNVVQRELNLPSFDDEPSFNFEEDAQVNDSVAPQKTIEYIVTKDDTLQKISKKFYGSYSKWSRIYQTNKSVIKNPDRISPGTKLQIPLD